MSICASENSRYERLMHGLIPRVGLILLLVAVAACDSARKEIVGKWKTDGEANAMVWEFAANGTVKTGGTTGKYSFGDGDRLKIQTQFATFVYEISVNGDTMSWKAPNGTTTRLTRVHE